jgi:hypothetical protein
LTRPRRKRTSCRQRNRIVGDPPLSAPMRPRPTDAEGLSVQRNGAPNSAYQLLCECSHKVLCEVMRHGERLGGLTFFDDEEASVTQGERVRYCPGCRSWLSLLSVTDLEGGPRRNLDVVSREGDRGLQRFADARKTSPTVLDEGASSGLGRILKSGS